MLKQHTQEDGANTISALIAMVDKVNDAILSCAEYNDGFRAAAYASVAMACMNLLLSGWVTEGTTLYISKDDAKNLAVAGDSLECIVQAWVDSGCPESLDAQRFDKLIGKA